MSDEKTTSKPRPKTRDLRAMQAEATEAARLASQMAAERDKAKEKATEAARKARCAKERAKRVTAKLARAKERDAFERLGRIYAKTFSIETDDSKHARWRQHFMQAGLTSEMCDIVGLRGAAQVDSKAPAQEFVVPGQSDA